MTGEILLLSQRKRILELLDELEEKWSEVWYRHSAEDRVEFIEILDEIKEEID